MIVLKIGGSVITKKSEERVPRIKAMKEIASEVSGSKLILIHGAGSYGHPLVRRGESPERMHESVVELNQIFLGYLRRNGVRAMRVSPMECVVQKNGRIRSMQVNQIRLLLENGYIPVLHGDVVTDLVRGFSILSGDQLAFYLAKVFHARKVGMGTDVDGIIAGSRIVRRITPENFRKIKDYISPPEITNVTQGMLGKVNELLRLAKIGIDSCIFNASIPGNVKKFLSCKLIGSVICR